MSSSSGRRPTRRDRVVLWTAVPVGVALFLVGQIGARTGVIALPFDPHHLLTQILGGIVLLYGLMHWH